MKIIKNILLITLSTIFLSACQSTDIKKEEKIKNHLENKKLYISEVSGIKVEYYKNLHIVFKTNKLENKNFLSIYTGCNNTFADYNIEGNIMKIGMGRSTRMACQDKDSQKLEAKINNIISKDLEVTMKDKDIILKNENNDYIKIKKILKIKLYI
jgi:heat shock protein HslJ